VATPIEGEILSNVIEEIVEAMRRRYGAVA
jgi:hypothetical protein